MEVKITNDNCPKCFSENVEVNDTQFENDYIDVQYYCHDCKTTYYIPYNMSGVAYIVEDDE